MLETLFGTKSRENVLLYLCARESGYAREISRYYKCGFNPIRRQLERMELGGVVVSKTVGRTILYTLNPRYPFITQLKALLERSIQFLDVSERLRLMNVRKRPRRVGKP